MKKMHVLSMCIAALVFFNAVTWFLVHSEKQSDLLHIYFFDIGQGDSIFIESPTHGRVLIDGGPDRDVLSELGKVLPFGDTRIDVIIGTHPDKDHIGGLPEIIGRYNVGAFIGTEVQSENVLSYELEQRIRDRGIPHLLAKRGTVIDFGDGAKLIILFPDRDVTTWETNDASVVALLMYKERSFLLTGDATLKTELTLLSLDEAVLNADVLKVGHHGSRTSTSKLFADAVSPEYSIISAGKNNTYGHPHKEVLTQLTQAGSVILSTAEKGTIMFETDGRELKEK